MLHLGNNIKTIRDLANLTQLDFAKKLNVKSKKGEFSADKIYTYESDTTIPPDHTLEAIAAFAGVTVEDLINKQLKASDISIEEISKFQEPPTNYIEKRRQIKNAPKEVYFPVYEGNTRLREDNQLTVYSDEPEMQTAVGFLPQHLFPGCDHAEKAFGNSMYPRVANQGVAAGKIVDKNHIVFNEMYGIHLIGGSPPIIKYVQRSEKKGCIKIVSESKSIPDDEIPIENITFMYRVLYIINPA